MKKSTMKVKKQNTLLVMSSDNISDQLLNLLNLLVLLILPDLADLHLSKEMKLMEVFLLVLVQFWGPMKLVRLLLNCS